MHLNWLLLVVSRNKNFVFVRACGKKRLYSALDVYLFPFSNVPFKL